MFLKIPTIIDEVSMDMYLRTSRIVYAEPWMLGDQMDPDTIKIHRIGTDNIIRTAITLDWLVGRGLPFVELVTWRGMSQRERFGECRRVFNIENILICRPYTMRSKIDHYVIYVPTRGDMENPKDFHFTAEQAAVLLSRMSVL